MERKKVIKKMAAVLLLVCLNLIFTVSVYAITDADVQTQVSGQGKEAVAGNVFIWFLCAIAFLKISQKIDSFMSSLGVSVGHTGGNMLAEAMVAGRALTGGKSFLGGSKGGGSMGNSSGGSVNPLSGGLAGAIGRQLEKSAMQNATSDGGGLFGKSSNISNDIVGKVAKGNIAKDGSITGDKAAKALNSYLGINDAGQLESSGASGSPIPSTIEGTQEAAAGFTDGVSIPFNPEASTEGGNDISATQNDGSFSEGAAFDSAEIPDSSLKGSSIPSFSELEAAGDMDAGGDSSSSLNYGSSEGDESGFNPETFGVPMTDTSIPYTSADGQSESITSTSEDSAHRESLNASDTLQIDDSFSGGYSPGTSWANDNKIPYSPGDELSLSEGAGKSIPMPGGSGLEADKSIPLSGSSSLEADKSIPMSGSSSIEADSSIPASSGSGIKESGIREDKTVPEASTINIPVSEGVGHTDGYSSSAAWTEASESTSDSGASLTAQASESSGRSTNNSPAVSSTSEASQSEAAMPVQTGNISVPGGADFDSGSSYTDSTSWAQPGIPPGSSIEASGAVSSAVSSEISGVEQAQLSSSIMSPAAETSIPKFSDVEIGGGRIMGTETSSAYPDGIKFGMYSTEQYMPPNGDFTVVNAVDGSKWYKQYAVDTVEKRPYKAENGKIAYNEKITKKLPPMPHRKDKV